MNSNEELRSLVSQVTGVPSALIGGETIEEMQASAKAINDFKDANNSILKSDVPEQQKTEADLFSDWFNRSLGIPIPEQIQSESIVSDAYPCVRDGGEILAIPEAKQTTADLFAECFRNELGWSKGGLL